jgi:hypothetical protein
MRKKDLSMKETPKGRITVTSSFYEMGGVCGDGRGGVLSPAPFPFYSRLQDRYLKTRLLLHL